MKKLLFYFALLFFIQKVNAQQEQKFSLYMFNKLIYNPACAGSNGYITINTGYRNQWQGIELSPNSKLVSIDGSIPKLKNKLGVGLMLSNNELGLINNSSINLSIAYRVRLSDSSWISIGTAMDIKRRTFNVSKLSVLDQNDAAFPQMNNSIYRPNYNLGLYYFSKDKFLGFSINNLISNSINYSEIERPITGKENMNMSLSAGYFLKLNNLYTFKQLFLIKSDFHSSAQLDLSPSILYKGLYEVGFSYRHKESIVGIFQASILNQLKLGYAYDFETGGLSNYQNGSHEIMLTYTFIKNKKIMLNPRNF